jgi:hypothetical protein
MHIYLLKMYKDVILSFQILRVNVLYYFLCLRFASKTSKSQNEKDIITMDTCPTEEVIADPGLLSSVCVLGLG